MLNSPCYNCPNRAAGCHSICESYAAFKAQRNRSKPYYQDEYAMYRDDQAVRALKERSRRAYA